MLAAVASANRNTSGVPPQTLRMVRLPFRREVLYAHRAPSNDRLMFAIDRHHDILRAVGGALGQRWAYYWRGAHHFPLDPDGVWTLAVCPESAGRVRFETCHLGRVRATKWGLESHVARAVAVALEARDEVLAEV